jgi:hypothetical protein
MMLPPAPAPLAPATPAPKTAAPAPQASLPLPAPPSPAGPTPEFTSGWGEMRVAPVTEMDAGGISFRPTIQGPAGWAGPGTAGVRDHGAYISGDQVHSSADPYGGGGPLYHPRSPDRGGHTSPQYNAIRAKGDATAGKVRYMASRLRGRH